MKFFLTTQPPSHRRFPPDHRPSAVCVHACVRRGACLFILGLSSPFVFKLSSSWLRSSPILWEEFWPPLTPGGGEEAGAGMGQSVEKGGGFLGFSPAQISFSR